MKHSTNQPSQRQLRVGEQIRHIVSDTLRRGHFHNEILLDASNITVTEVRISPDLKNATAYVMSLGGMDMEEILPALNADHQVFQKDINANTNLKFTPKMKFVLDTSFEQVQKIDEIISNLHYADEDVKEDNQ